MRIQPKVLGIGRPNLILGTDFGGAAALTSFTLHMSIDDLNPAETLKLRSLLDEALITGKRNKLKKELRRLLSIRDNFKGGHKLVAALADKVADDTADAGKKKKSKRR